MLLFCGLFHDSKGRYTSFVGRHSLKPAGENISGLRRSIGHSGCAKRGSKKNNTSHFPNGQKRIVKIRSQFLLTQVQTTIAQGISTQSASSPVPLSSSVGRTAARSHGAHAIRLPATVINTGSGAEIGTVKLLARKKPMLAKYFFDSSSTTSPRQVNSSNHQFIN